MAPRCSLILVVAAIVALLLEYCVSPSHQQFLSFPGDFSAAISASSPAADILLDGVVAERVEIVAFPPGMRTLTITRSRIHYIKLSSNPPNPFWNGNQHVIIADNPGLVYVQLSGVIQQNATLPGFPAIVIRNNTFNVSHRLYDRILPAGERGNGYEPTRCVGGFLRVRGGETTFDGRRFQLAVDDNIFWTAPFDADAGDRAVSSYELIFIEFGKERSRIDVLDGVPPQIMHADRFSVSRNKFLVQDVVAHAVASLRLTDAVWVEYGATASAVGGSAQQRGLLLCDNEVTTTGSGLNLDRWIQNSVARRPNAGEDGVRPDWGQICISVHAGDHPDQFYAWTDYAQNQQEQQQPGTTVYAAYVRAPLFNLSGNSFFLAKRDMTPWRLTVVNGMIMAPPAPAPGGLGGLVFLAERNRVEKETITLDSVPTAAERPTKISGDPVPPQSASGEATADDARQLAMLLNEKRSGFLMLVFVDLGWCFNIARISISNNFANASWGGMGYKFNHWRARNMTLLRGAVSSMSNNTCISMDYREFECALYIVNIAYPSTTTDMTAAPSSSSSAIPILLRTYAMQFDNNRCYARNYRYSRARYWLSESHVGCIYFADMLADGNTILNNPRIWVVDGLQSPSFVSMNSNQGLLSGYFADVSGVETGLEMSAGVFSEGAGFQFEAKFNNFTLFATMFMPDGEPVPPHHKDNYTATSLAIVRIGDEVRAVAGKASYSVFDLSHNSGNVIMDSSGECALIAVFLYKPVKLEADSAYPTVFRFSNNTVVLNRTTDGGGQERLVAAIAFLVGVSPSALPSVSVQIVDNTVMYTSMKPCPPSTCIGVTIGFTAQINGVGPIFIARNRVNITSHAGGGATCVGVSVTTVALPEIDVFKRLAYVMPGEVVGATSFVVEGNVFFPSDWTTNSLLFISCSGRAQFQTLRVAGNYMHPTYTALTSGSSLFGIGCPTSKVVMAVGGFRVAAHVDCKEKPNATFSEIIVSSNTLRNTQAIVRSHTKLTVLGALTIVNCTSDFDYAAGVVPQLPESETSVGTTLAHVVGFVYMLRWEAAVARLEIVNCNVRIAASCSAAALLAPVESFLWIGLRDEDLATGAQRDSAAISFVTAHGMTASSSLHVINSNIALSCAALSSSGESGEATAARSTARIGAFLFGATSKQIPRHVHVLRSTMSFISRGYVAAFDLVASAVYPAVATAPLLPTLALNQSTFFVDDLQDPALGPAQRRLAWPAADGAVVIRGNAAEKAVGSPIDLHAALRCTTWNGRVLTRRSAVVARFSIPVRLITQLPCVMLREHSRSESRSSNETRSEAQLSESASLSLSRSITAGARAPPLGIDEATLRQLETASQAGAILAALAGGQHAALAGARGHMMLRLAMCHLASKSAAFFPEAAAYTRNATERVLTTEPHFPETLFPHFGVGARVGASYRGAIISHIVVHAIVFYIICWMGSNTREKWKRHLLKLRRQLSPDAVAPGDTSNAVTIPRNKNRDVGGGLLSPAEFIRQQEEQQQQQEAAAAAANSGERAETLVDYIYDTRFASRSRSGSRPRGPQEAVTTTTPPTGTTAASVSPRRIASGRSMPPLFSGLNHSGGGGGGGRSASSSSVPLSKEELRYREEEQQRFEEQRLRDERALAQVDAALEAAFTSSVFMYVSYDRVWFKLVIAFSLGPVCGMSAALAQALVSPLDWLFVLAVAALALFCIASARFIWICVSPLPNPELSAAPTASGGAQAPNSAAATAPPNALESPLLLDARDGAVSDRSSRRRRRSNGGARRASDLDGMMSLSLTKNHTFNAADDEEMLDFPARRSASGGRSHQHHHQHRRSRHGGSARAVDDDVSSIATSVITHPLSPAELQEREERHRRRLHGGSGRSASAQLRHGASSSAPNAVADRRSSSAKQSHVSSKSITAAAAGAAQTKQAPTGVTSVAVEDNKKKQNKFGSDVVTSDRCPIFTETSKVYFPASRNGEEPSVIVKKMRQLLQHRVGRFLFSGLRAWHNPNVDASLHVHGQSAPACAPGLFTMFPYIMSTFEGPRAGKKHNEQRLNEGVVSPVAVDPKSIYVDCSVKHRLRTVNIFIMVLMNILCASLTGAADVNQDPRACTSTYVAVVLLNAAALCFEMWLHDVYFVPMRDVSFHMIEVFATLGGLVFVGVVFAPLETADQVADAAGGTALKVAQLLTTLPGAILGPPIMALSLMRVLLIKCAGVKLIPKSVFAMQLKLELERVERKLFARLRRRHRRAAAAAAGRDADAEDLSSEEEDESKKPKPMGFWQRLFSGDASWELLDE